MRSSVATATTAKMPTTACMSAAALSPHGQREQHQAKRRYVQPAPHTGIIAPFELFSDGENTLRQPRTKPPARSSRRPKAALSALLFVLALRLCFGLRFCCWLFGLGRFRLLGRSLGWLAHLSNRNRLRRHRRLCRHHRLCRRSGLVFIRGDVRGDVRCDRRCRSRRNFSLPLGARLTASLRRSSNRRSNRRGLRSSAPLA